MLFNQPLITISIFVELVSTQKVVVLDATIDKVTEKIDNSNIELIPNSLFFDIEGTLSDHHSGLPHSMVDGQTFQNEMQNLGIDDEDIIVIYDRWGVYSSPRAWWMLKYMGHREVYVLNGGMPAWKLTNQAVVSKHDTASKTGNFSAKPQAHWLESKQSLLGKLGQSSITINDARGTGRFQGTALEPRAGIRSGHIPTSTNIPFDTLIDNIYIKNDIELKTIFDGKIDPHKQNIFTCGSGITAAILALAATQIGTENVAVYDGSWAEWGADNQLPIA